MRSFVHVEGAFQMGEPLLCERGAVLYLMLTMRFWLQAHGISVKGTTFVFD